VSKIRLSVEFSAGPLVLRSQSSFDTWALMRTACSHRASTKRRRKESNPRPLHEVNRRRIRELGQVCVYQEVVYWNSSLNCYVHHARLCHLQLHDDHYPLHPHRPLSISNPRPSPPYCQAQQSPQQRLDIWRQQGIRGSTGCGLHALTKGPTALSLLKHCSDLECDCFWQLFSIQATRMVLRVKIK